MPGAVEDDVVTVSVELFDPLGGMRTILGFTEAPGPGGVTIRVWLTAPVKPFTLERMILDRELLPWTTDRLDGLAEIVKSGIGGGGALTTVNLTATL